MNDLIKLFIFSGRWKQFVKIVNQEKITKAGDENPRLKKLEAAGIEPASCDISLQASTCVVDFLNLTLSSPNRQGESRARQNSFSSRTYCRETGPNRLRYATLGLHLLGKPMHGRLFLGGKSHVIFGVYFLVGF